MISATATTNNSSSSSLLIFDHREWGDEIARNKDRSVKYPMEINEPWSLDSRNHLSHWFVGPLRSRYPHFLRQKYATTTKNTSFNWHPIAFSGLSILFDVAALVILQFCFDLNEIFCHFFVSFLLGAVRSIVTFKIILFLWSNVSVSIAFSFFHCFYFTPIRVVYGPIGLNKSFIFCCIGFSISLLHLQGVGGFNNKKKSAIWKSIFSIA